MKKYNVQNYTRYKNDLKKSTPNSKEWLDYDRNELIIKFMPLVENIARKFPTSQQASGVLDITDLIQEGNSALVKAVDNIDRKILEESENVEQTLKSFLSKRIKGAIRRAIDINRGNMRIPEYKLNELRKNFGKDLKITQLFFNQVFSSLDKSYNSDDDNPSYQIADESEPYNIDILNAYLLSIMEKHLTDKEYQILRMSFGLDCDKMSAKDIADALGITGASNYVRVSEIKKSAIQKLIEEVPPEQVIDYL